MASTFRRKGGFKKSSNSSANQQGVKSNPETTQPAEKLGPASNNPSPTKASSSSLFRGCKPWSGGITRTSFGLRDLDSILGGGQPLGTCLLLEHADQWTQQALTSCLLRYWCAEAISHDQCLWIPTTEEDNENTFDAENMNFNNYYDDDDDETNLMNSCYQFLSPTQAKELLQSLPRNLHWDKHNKKTKGSADEIPNDEEEVEEALLETLQEEDEEEEEEEDAVNSEQKEKEILKNAWQYRDDVQQERSGVVTSKATKTTTTTIDNVYCHSYDLKGRLMDQCDSILDVHQGGVPKCRKRKLGGNSISSTSRQCGYQLFQHLYTKLRSLLNAEPISNVAQINKVVRIVFCIQDNTTIPAFTTALSLLLYEIRNYQWPVVMFVSTPNNSSSDGSDMVALRRLVDIVLQGEHFASRYTYPPPVEFQHLHGLCMIPKVTTMTGSTANGLGGGHFADLTMTRRPLANLYGFKRDHRKLHIQLLHIPPAGGGGDDDDDDDAAKTVKPTAGGCSTHMVQQQSRRGVPTISGGGGGSMMDF